MDVISALGSVLNHHHLDFMHTPHRRTLPLFAAVLGFASLAPAHPLAPQGGTPPATITVTGVVRDFKERSVPGGHPDFEKRPAEGFGHYCKNVEEELAGGVPEYNSCGFKVTKQWKNSANKNICWLLYDDDLGDIRGDKDGGSPDGGFQSESTFNKLWKDDLNCNVSAPLTLTLQRQSNGLYVFDSNTDPQYVSLGGFFPIDGQLFGNSAGTPVHNFHFTYVVRTTFVYDADGPQTLPFRSDDSLWVFIDGRNVIDLGGVHPALEQEVQLNRLGLADGQTYSIDIYYAERHRPTSSLKITLPGIADPVPPVPTITAGYD
jgi:fibro-slime domain-containing protein